VSTADSRTVKARGRLVDGAPVNVSAAVLLDQLLEFTATILEPDLYLLADTTGRVTVTELLLLRNAC